MATLTTTRLGLPYPDGNERVTDGDNAMGAIVAKLDDLQATGVPYRVQAGLTAFASAPTTDTGVLVTVTLAASRFTQPPIVVAVGTSTGYGAATVASVTTASFVGRYYNPTTVTPSTPSLYWLALQMSPASAPGRAAPDVYADPGIVALEATCATPDCENATVGILIPAMSDPTERWPVVCGVCGEPITDITDAPRP